MIARLFFVRLEKQIQRVPSLFQVPLLWSVYQGDLDLLLHQEGSHKVTNAS